MVKIDFEKLKSEYNETQKGFSLFKRKTPSFCPSGFCEVTKLTEFEIYKPSNVDDLIKKCGDVSKTSDGLPFYKGVAATTDDGAILCVATAYELGENFCIVKFSERDEKANLLGYVAQMIGNLCLNGEKLPIVKTKDAKLTAVLTSAGYEKIT